MTQQALHADKNSNFTNRAVGSAFRGTNIADLDWSREALIGDLRVIAPG